MICYCVRCPVVCELVFVFSFVARPGGRGRFIICKCEQSAFPRCIRHSLVVFCRFITGCVVCLVITFDVFGK